MCHESALVERPSCSSTRNHSIFDHPWPPYSRSCSPPLSPASTDSLEIRCRSSSGIPPLRSASSSFGIRTSSTKRRARSRRSCCSAVSSAAPALSGVRVASMLIIILRSRLSAVCRGCAGPRSRPSGHAPARCRRPDRCARPGPLHRSGTEPRTSTRSHDEALDARTLALHRPGRRRPFARSAATLSGSSRSGSGVSESQASSGRIRPRW